MKRYIAAILGIALCLSLLITATAQEINYCPGPFTFSLPAAANTAEVSLFGSDMEIAGNYEGVPYLLTLTYTPMDLGMSETWEPILRGLHSVQGSKTVAESFVSEAQYSVDYLIAKKDGQFTGIVSAGCMTGYMSILCTFSQSEYSSCESLLKKICGTLAYDPSAIAGKDVFVWIAGLNGTKYHNSPTCCGMKDPVKITLDEAIRRGLSPCKICH